MPNQRIVEDNEGRLLNAEPKDRRRQRRETSECRTNGSSVCFEQVVGRSYFLLSWFLPLLFQIELLASCVVVENHHLFRLLLSFESCWSRPSFHRILFVFGVVVIGHHFLGCLLLLRFVEVGPSCLLLLVALESG